MPTVWRLKHSGIKAILSVRHFVFGLALAGLVTAPAAFAQGSGNFFLNSDVDISPVSANVTDPSVAANPNNISNIFVAGVSSATNGLFTSYTVNLTVWTTSNGMASVGSNYSPALGSNALVPAFGEPSAAWDANSNLFLAYEPANGQGVAVAVSTNGGMTFFAFTNLATNDSTDQPRIVTAPGFTTNGSNCANVWVVYKDYSFSTNGAFGYMMAAGLQTTNIGTNAISAFSTPILLPGSTNGGFPDIAIGPSNQVMVAYQNNINSSSTSSVYINVNTNVFATNGFNNRVTVSSDAVGGTTYIPAVSSGDGINAGVGVAWDCNPASAFYGRSYLVYTAVGTNGLPSMNIVTRYSINSGSHWSSELQVNDDTNLPGAANSHFLPRMAVDPVTGSISFCWCDCRNDVPGSGPNYWESPVTYPPAIFPPPTNMFTNFFTQDMVANDDYVPYATISTNGTTNVFANIPLLNTNNSANTALLNTEQQFSTEEAAANSVNGLGHHLGLAYLAGNIYPVWPDNTTNILVTGEASWPNLNLAFGFSQLRTARLGITVQETPYPPTSDETLYYYVIVTNYGPFTANNVQITNLLSSNLTLIGQPTPAPGGTYSVNGQTVVFSLSGLPVGTPVTNLIRVVASQSGYATNVASVYTPVPTSSTVSTSTNIITNSAFISSASGNLVTNIVLINGENLAVGIAASPIMADLGSPITFTITLTNFGPSVNGLIYITNFFTGNLTQITNITVTNNLGQSIGSYTVGPTNIIFNLGTLASNSATAGVTISYTAVPVAANLTDTNATNTVIVASSDFNPNADGTNIASVVVNLQGEDLGIGVTVSSPTADINDTLTYTVNITNFGPSSNGTITFTNFYSDNIGNVTLQEPLPGTILDGANIPGDNLFWFTIEPLPVYGTFSMSFTANAISVFPADTNGIDIAYVTSTDFDPNTNNNIASTLTIINGEDLGVNMIGTPTNVPLGQPVTFIVCVTNYGPSVTNTVGVTNVLSPNLTNITVLESSFPYTINGNVLIFYPGCIPIGESTMFEFTAIAGSIGTVTNSVTVGSTDFDTNLSNNYAQVVTTIIPAPPIITNFTVIPYASSAFITWQTPYPATVQVAYWQTNGVTNYSVVSGPATNHTVLLTGLGRDTNIYFSAMTWEQETPYTTTPYITNGVFATVDTLILNTSDAYYTGIWVEGSPSLAGYYGAYFNQTGTTNGNSTASAIYVPFIITPGYYNVSTWYPQAASFSTNTPMVVTGSSNAVVCSVNQTINGGGWWPLTSDVYYAGGSNGNAIIYNNSGQTNGSKSVAANAMRWSYDPAQDYSSAGLPPLWWTQFYFGSNAVPATSNYSAYVFGVAPGGTASFSMNTPFSNAITFTFSPCQGGRLYQLQLCTNLANPSWTALTNQPQSTNGIGTFTVSLPTAAGTYYRLSAEVLAQ